LRIFITVQQGTISSPRPARCVYECRPWSPQY